MDELSKDFNVKVNIPQRLDRPVSFNFKIKEEFRCKKQFVLVIKVLGRKINSVNLITRVGVAWSPCTVTEFAGEKNKTELIQVALKDKDQLVGRTKIDIFNHSLTIFYTKLANWKSSLINKAGRLTLVNYVVSALPNHVITCTLLPSGVIEEMEQLRRSFF